MASGGKKNMKMVGLMALTSSGTREAGIRSGSSCVGDYSVIEIEELGSGIKRNGLS